VCSTSSRHEIQHSVCRLYAQTDHTLTQNYEAIHSSEPSVNFNIPYSVTENRTLHSYRHENLKFQIVVLFIIERKKHLA
jgi:hypothetical protein